MNSYTTMVEEVVGGLPLGPTVSAGAVEVAASFQLKQEQQQDGVVEEEAALTSRQQGLAWEVEEGHHHQQHRMPLGVLEAAPVTKAKKLKAKVG
jgi:hypothetical protein